MAFNGIFAPHLIHLRDSCTPQEWQNCESLVRSHPHPGHFTPFDDELVADGVAITGAAIAPDID